MTPEEKLMEAIGGLSDELVMLAVGYNTAESGRKELESVTVEKFNKKDIRRFRIRNAVLASAAALALVGGGIFLWNRFGNIPVSEPTEPVQPASEISAGITQAPETVTTLPPGIAPPEPDLSAFTIGYSGDRVINAEDFEVFDKYFYGVWGKDQSTMNESYVFNYSDNGENGFFDYNNGRLIDIYTDENFAYIVADQWNADNGYGGNIYAVPLSQPDVMYRYELAVEEPVTADKYSMKLRRLGAYQTETDEMGCFGRYRAVYAGIPVETEPIDKDLDCERIVLDKAQALKELIYNYMNTDRNKLVFDLGARVQSTEDYDAVKVVDPELSSYEDFKRLFSADIYDKYIDYMNSSAPCFTEIGGQLCFCESMSGHLGTVETWYTGFDVTDTEIIGHFAELGGVEWTGSSAEYLNDMSNYHFYDIIIQNVGGNYCITNVKSADGRDSSLAYEAHGLFYNEGIADRSLITDERVKPKEYTEKYNNSLSSASKLSPEEKTQIQKTLKEFGDFLYGYYDCKIIKKHTGQKLIVIDDWQWYKVVEGSVTTMDQLKEKALRSMTKNMYDSLELDKKYAERDGELYLWSGAGEDGSLLGTDEAYITAYNNIGSSEVTVYMHAHGDGEKWGLENDFDEDFTVKLKRTPSGFAVEECDLRARGYLTWAYDPDYDVF